MKNYNEVKATEFSGVDYSDSMDLVDAYATKAEWKDGTELTDDELDTLNDDNWEVVYECLMLSLN